MDLVKLITDKLQKVESSGKLEEIVENHLMSCLDDIVRDSFNWNGEAKKSIEEALKDKLAINPKNLNLHRYNKIVTDLVEKHANETIVENLSKNVKGAIDSIVEPLEKDTWKLSEIMGKFIDSIDKSYDGVMEDLYGECSLHVSNDRDGFVWVRFDREPEREYYHCDNSLFIYEGRLSSVALEGVQFTPMSTRLHNDFETFMFKLYCEGAKIEVDEHNCELEYSREDAH